MRCPGCIHNCGRRNISFNQNVFNVMYKILILAYMIGQSPIDTQQTFQMQQTFDTIEECKKELL